MISSTAFAAYRDPRYIQGKALLRAKQYDAAIDAFCELLEALDQQFGPNHLESSPILFEYGSALVLKAESAANLFGDASSSNEQQQSNMDGASGSGHQSQAGGSDEDLEIAWEVLEVARVILSTHTAKNCRLLLARVYLRLADLSLDQGNPEQAIMDYQHCLQERIRFLDCSDRLLADVHAALAVAYLYSSARHSDKAAQRSSSIHHYMEAVKVFELLLEKIYVKTYSPIIAAFLPQLRTKYSLKQVKNDKDFSGSITDSTAVFHKKKIGKILHHGQEPKNITSDYSRAIDLKEIDWQTAMANGWHPASATDNVKRTPGGKKLRVKRTHPAAILTREEEQIDELTMALKDLREKVADTIKLKNDGIAAENRERQKKLAEVNAAAYGTTVAAEEAQLSKQNSKPSVSVSNGSNGSGSSSNMMMSPSLSASSSMRGQVNPSNGASSMSLFATDSKSTVTLSTSAMHGNIGTASSSGNAPTPDSIKTTTVVESAGAKRPDGVTVEYGFGKPTLPSSMATNILKGRNKTKKRKPDQNPLLANGSSTNLMVVKKKVKTAQ